MSRETSALNVSSFGVTLLCQQQGHGSEAALIGCPGRFYKPSLEFIFASAWTCANVLGATAQAFVCSVGTEVGLTRKSVSSIDR